MIIKEWAFYMKEGHNAGQVVIIGSDDAAEAVAKNLMESENHGVTFQIISRKVEEWEAER